MGTERRPLLLALPAAALLIFAVGVTAAFAVRVVSVHPSKSLDQMLPATTAFYLSADLKPSGLTGAALDRVEQAFTSQPGWANIAREIDDTQRKSGQAGTCYRDTKQTASSYLQYLGHDTALALIGTDGLNLSSITQGSWPAAGQAGLSSALQRNLVVVASVDYHATLVQLLFGSPISAGHGGTGLQKVTDYKGTAIYQLSISSCGQLGPSVPKTVYAALYQGYAILGVQPGPVERVLDTAVGRAASLITDKTYDELMAQLPDGRLARYYLNGRALRKVGLLDGLNRLAPASASLSVSRYQAGLQPMAGALTVDGDGLHLAQTAWHPSMSVGRQAGAAAGFLPSDVVAFVSLQGVPQTIKKISAELKRDDFMTADLVKTLSPTLNDLTADMTGEADLVMFPSSFKSQPAAGVGVPLTIMWSVKNDASAARHLAAVLVRQHAANQFVRAVTVDGTPYEVTSGGPGYTVRKGWAIVSLAVRQTIGALSSSSAPKLATVPDYKAAVPAGAVPSSIWYVNLHQLRTELETALLPIATANEASQYRKQALPLLAPLQTLSGSAGTSRDRHAAISILTIQVRKP